MSEEEIAKDILEVIPLVMQFIRKKSKLQDKFGYAFPQYRVLAFLSHEERTNSEIAEWQGISCAACTRMLDNLVKEDLISRRHSAKDRREIEVRLTSKGKRVLDRMRAYVQVQLADLISQLKSEKKQEVQIGLSALREIFK